MQEGLVSSFRDKGYAAPVPVLEPRACRGVLAGLAFAPAPDTWEKGHGASSVAFFELATAPAILDRVRALIGDDVMLWGASLAVREPGEYHAWHTDHETAPHEGGTVSVWVGLANTQRRSSLIVVEGSHRFGRSVQACAHDAGRAREAISAADVAAWGAEPGSPRGAVSAIDIADGQAIFFDGRLWHGSHNTSGERRVAVVLQYARPDLAIRVPDPRASSPEEALIASSRPPCVMVSGVLPAGAGAVNRFVPGPASAARGGFIGPLTTWVRDCGVPLEVDAAVGWNGYDLCRAHTDGLDELESHVSVLAAGRCPHAPHAHLEDELLVVLDGAAELEALDPEGHATRHSVTRGSVAYYPAGIKHTIHNVSARSVRYVMFKWGRSERRARGDEVPTQVLPRPEPPPLDARTYVSRTLFEGPTVHLRRLEVHLTALAPGAGYAPHADPYDLAIVVLDGVVETGGRRVGSGAVIFFAAGELHGMRNVGDETARYLVVELEGRGSAFDLSALTAMTRTGLRRVLMRTPRALVERVPRAIRQRVRHLLQ